MREKKVLQCYDCSTIYLSIDLPFYCRGIYCLSHAFTAEDDYVCCGKGALCFPVNCFIYVTFVY